MAGVFSKGVEVWCHGQICVQRNTCATQERADLGDGATVPTDFVPGAENTLRITHAVDQVSTYGKTFVAQMNSLVKSGEFYCLNFYYLTFTLKVKL